MHQLDEYVQMFLREKTNYNSGCTIIKFEWWHFLAEMKSK